MRIIQAGLGRWGTSWFEVASAADGIAIAAVAEPAPQNRLRAEAELGLARSRVFDSLDEAMASAAADAVLITSPPATHHALATAALEAGLHVLCEKPLATNLTDARSLVQTAQRTGRVLMVSQNYRFRPPARAMQRAVADGRLGEIVSVAITCRRDMRSVLGPRDFRYQMAHPYIVDMGIHHLDLLRAVTGQEIAEVYARSWRAPDSSFQHDPAVAAILTLTGGATVDYAGDWDWRGEETTWSGHWEIVGAHGRLSWTADKSASEGLVTLERPDADPEPIRPPTLTHLDRDGVLNAFREAVDHGGKVETSADDNFNSLAAVTACVESIETSAPISVPALAAGA